MGLKWLVSWLDPYIWLVCGSARIKSKHHTDTHTKEIGLCLQILITIQHSIVNSAYKWDDLMYPLKETNRHVLPITILKQRRSDFCRCFIVDSLMQHEFCCVNLIGKSWRTWKMNHITPTCLGHPAFLSLKAQLGGWMLAILEVFCKWEYICIEKLAGDLSLSWGAVIPWPVLPVLLIEYPVTRSPGILVSWWESLSSMHWSFLGGLLKEIWHLDIRKKGA